MHKDPTQVYDAKIIEEEGSEMDCNEAPDSRLEENKDSNMSNASENEASWFDLEFSENFKIESTPRFDKDKNIQEISMMNMIFDEDKIEENPKNNPSKLKHF